MRIIGHQHRSAATYRRKQALVTQLCHGNQVASEELRLLLKMEGGDKLRGRGRPRS
ncbi:hypothetical protein [Candidatus Litorirhabdus singularis]|uniref:hypothetical protein n=1 Tax=Candidatus Litorirhabdus singularis TaxID=2518993 RepID=UPI002431AF47|nr:hypothetical protein [Candidatus Litorirhabdus singularis]